MEIHKNFNLEELKKVIKFSSLQFEMKRILNEFHWEGFVGILSTTI
jgi:hypothetical protein